MIAQFLFDEIMVWSAQKKPKKSLGMLLRDIEKILDEIENRGYNENNVSLNNL